jgi:hypothetical protein
VVSQEKPQEQADDGARYGVRFEGELFPLDNDAIPTWREAGQIARYFGASWDDLHVEETMHALQWITLIREGKDITLAEFGELPLDTLEEITDGPPTKTPEAAGNPASSKSSGSSRGKSKT